LPLDDVVLSIFLANQSAYVIDGWFVLFASFLLSILPLGQVSIVMRVFQASLA
jgi:hypothetical protein